MKRKVLSLAAALCMILTLLPTAAFAAETEADPIVYDEEGEAIKVTNVIELGGWDPMFGQFITCSAPAEITLKVAIENFGANYCLDYDENEGFVMALDYYDTEELPLDNAPTYVGYSGKTILDAGASITLTEPGCYFVYARGNLDDTLLEEPETYHNTGSSSIIADYVITIPGADDGQGVAYASTQTVTVDGEAVEFEMYALRDADGNDTNYIKLRDLAYVLNETDARFSVGWDEDTSTISVTSGEDYGADGTEMTTPFEGDRAYTGGGQTVIVNGTGVELTAIVLNDDDGGGYTYFKLRDLGDVLGFTVGWTAGDGVTVETN